MRFGWVLPVTFVLIAAACSGGGSTTSSLGPLPVEGLVKGSEFDCDSLAAFDVSFVPSKSHGEAEVYAVNARHIDPDYVRELAQKLGIPGEPVEQPMDLPFGGPVNWDVPHQVPSYVVTDGDAELVVEQRTADVRYFRHRWPADVTGGEAVSDETARRTAEQALERLGLPVPGGLAEITRQPGADISLTWRPKDFHVIDTYTPLGVEIGMTSDGAVEALFYFWHDLRPIGKYPLASEAEALKRLKRCDGITNSGRPSPPPVDGVRIEYMGVPPQGPFQYFVPVYRFGNDLDTIDTPEAASKRFIEGREAEAWVLAIADEFVEAPPSE